MSIYSHGIESILKVELTEEQAAAYNRVIYSFFDQEMLRSLGAYKALMAALYFKDVEEGDMATYIGVVRLINAEIDRLERNNKSSEVSTLFLVKN